jgi:hypothetical protein
MTILVEISAGELLDKITILVIKQERISDPAKLANVRKEHEMLMSVYRGQIAEVPELVTLRNQLTEINSQLWDIEDEIRDHERRKDFGQRFVELARSVYRTNDQRSSTKRTINDLLKSALVEEKSYSAY